METRREFIKKTIMATGTIVFGHDAFAGPPPLRKVTETVQPSVYRALNGNPADNLSKVIELIGGIGNLIGPEDVVLIKPNAQWWNQGAPNLSAIKTFVELTMERPGGFDGEVVIAENCHRGRTPWTSKSAGWAHPFERNSDISGIQNLNALCGFLKKKYGSRFSTVHWIDVDDGGKRVFTPKDGVGYVYCDGTGGVPLIKCDNGVHGENYRAAIMTYPVFSTDKGTIVDFKNGIWERGTYTGQPLRFINFAALNHHSSYGGATSAVKNYMGIADLSGGPDPHNEGLLTGNYYNFRSEEHTSELQSH